MKGKIFTVREVKAILNKSKVMFREVIKLPAEIGGNYDYEVEPCPGLDDENYFGLSLKGVRYLFQIKRPYKVGQKIFCKESFCRPQGEVLYRADFKSDQDYEWWAACYMAERASRLTLLIKEIKVERLGEISEEDARKEGVERGAANGEECGYKDYLVKNLILADAKDSFKTLWNATHKKPEEKFKASPWVWCVSFEVINN